MRIYLLIAVTIGSVFSSDTEELCERLQSKDNNDKGQAFGLIIRPRFDLFNHLFGKMGLGDFSQIDRDMDTMHKRLLESLPSSANRPFYGVALGRPLDGAALKDLQEGNPIPPIPFWSLKEDQGAGSHTSEEKKQMIPPLPMVDAGKGFLSVNEYWSSDQVVMDQNGIRIRHRDSQHPEGTETVIQVEQVKPNPLVPAPIPLVAIPKNAGEAEVSSDEEMEKRQMLEPFFNLNDKESEKEEIVIGQAEASEELIVPPESQEAECERTLFWRCVRSALERHRQCHHRWLAHSLFFALLSLAFFLLFFNCLRRRRHHHRKHAHLAKSLKGEQDMPALVITLPPSYEALYPDGEKKIIPAEVIVALPSVVAEAPKEEEKPLLS